MKSSFKKYLWLMICLWISFTLGCAGKPVSLPDINGQDADLQRGRPLEATACGFQLLLFIPIAINDRQERAMNALKMQARGDSISNVKVQERWVYGFVGTSYCTTMKARAYPRLAAQ